MLCKMLKIKFCTQQSLNSKSLNIFANNTLNGDFCEREAYIGKTL